MNVFGVGLPEIAVIGALALLIFGPKKLPELGRTLGKTLKGFQSASSEFERELSKAMAEPESSSGSDLDEEPGIQVGKSEEDLQTKPTQPEN